MTGLGSCLNLHFYLLLLFKRKKKTTNLILTGIFLPHQHKKHFFHKKIRLSRPLNCQPFFLCSLHRSSSHRRDTKIKDKNSAALVGQLVSAAPSHCSSTNDRSGSESPSSVTPPKLWQQNLVYGKPRFCSHLWLLPVN